MGGVLHLLLLLNRLPGVSHSLLCFKQEVKCKGLEVVVVMGGVIEWMEGKVEETRAARRVRERAQKLEMDDSQRKKRDRNTGTIH